MIASEGRAPRARALAAIAGATLALALATGCRTPAAVPDGLAFGPDGRLAAPLPDVADHTAAQVAAAALASDRAAARSAVRRIEAVDRVLRASDREPTGLAPVATDLANATLDDDRAYRQATGELLERGDLDPALRERLEQAVEDDPLRLANARLWDARVSDFGYAFNTVAEPLGRSIMTLSLAPYRVGKSLLDYAVYLWSRDALTLQRRQALAHWKQFLAHHPRAPEAELLMPRIERAEARWRETQRDRAYASARRALARGQPRLALVLADRARRFSPEDEDASELREESARAIRAERQRRLRSVRASAEPGAVAAGTHALAVALLLPGADALGEAEALLGEGPDGPFAGEARFARALALAEAGRESDAWAELESLAGADGSMSRHAGALLADPQLRADAAFRTARRRARWERVQWVALGPPGRYRPGRSAKETLLWIADLPSAAQRVASFPLRLIQLPWAPTSAADRTAARHARHYLARHPQGERSEDLREWLAGFEEDRGNWIAALALAEERGEDPEEIAALRERAAEQALAAARREKHTELRLALLDRVAREYEHTEAGRSARAAVRHEIEHTTPQNIRISRGFLLENPEVAGPRGLDLAPGLLDGDPSNGELHPDGVGLLGGRTVELAFVDAGGDEDDPPALRYRDLSEARLARLVSRLEETSFRNALEDRDDTLGADAQRDVYFERVRLGLADEVDPRSLASSHYEYRGLRERYGMVRARESILPFDIVIQGSLTDLSLGAFPRIRKPRETPDAFLYR